ncbi:hypothetical protein LguiA_030839 [Lonicera macranthoides]
MEDEINRSTLSDEATSLSKNSPSTQAILASALCLTASILPQETDPPQLFALHCTFQISYS